MAITTAISLLDLKDEIINDLRSNLTDPRSRITLVSQYFSGTGTATTFDVTNASTMKCVKYVKVGATTMKYGSEYTVTFRGTNIGRITFTNAPAVGTNNIEVNYGYGSSAMIYGDRPRQDLYVANYPRIAVSAMINTKELDVGGRAFTNDIIISMLVLTEHPAYLDELCTDVRNRILANKKNYYNFRYIYCTAMNDINTMEDRTTDVVGRVMDFAIPDRIEVIN